MKRNKQQKYRIKIIQELHLKKYQQEQLDECIKGGYTTYNEIYHYRRMPYCIKLLIELRRLRDDIIDKTSPLITTYSEYVNNFISRYNKVFGGK